MVEGAIHTVNRLKVQLFRCQGDLFPGLSRTLLARLLGEVETTARFVRCGLRAVEIIRAEPQKLLVQRPVRCEVIPVKDATSLDFLDAYFAEGDGQHDWQITRSMQFRLLRAYASGGLWEDVRGTDYWQWHVKLREAGINERTDEWIAKKLQRLLAVFESIRERGYQYGRLSNYIWVLKKPLIHTRYGYQYCPNGLEIFDGHHRAAALACLGYGWIYVLVVEDVATHTPFGVPLDEVATPHQVN